jgi:hypothetical protein
MLARWGYKLARAIGRPSCRVAALAPYIARRRSELRADDVFLASYPRSGNTWSRLLLIDVALQLHGLEAGPKSTFSFIQGLIPEVDRDNRLESADAPICLKPRILKTHEFWSRSIRRAIIVYRLPAASLVSFYHFHRTHGPLRQLTATGIDAFCRNMASDWVRHLHSYVDAIESGRLDGLLISYERLHAEPAAVLLDACRFLGWDADLAMCERAASHHNFSSCQAEHNTRLGTESPFYRRGETHGYATELDSSTIAFLQKHADPAYQRAEQLAQAQRARQTARKSA